jgi:hypothetical protein
MRFLANFGREGIGVVKNFWGFIAFLLRNFAKNLE